MNTSILYIEDNPLNMRLVKKILGHAGYTIFEAIDGLKGLELAQCQMPDLILVDVNLPDIDGLEVVKRLKANPELSKIPAVALTSNVMHGDKDRCMAAGCDGYLAKPVARLELLNLINYFMAREARRVAV